MLIKIENIDGNVKWNGEVYSRHGDKFSGWWYYSRRNHYCVQYQDINNVDINGRENIIAVYVKIENMDFNTLNYEYLKYIGGQDYIFAKNTIFH